MHAMPILSAVFGSLIAIISLPSFAAPDTKPQPPATAAPDKATEFPLRPQYIDVPIIETAEFNKKFSEVLVIDVRSPYEYDTLRIKDALLIPVTDKKFTEKVRELRENNAAKPLVFYCNGKTCRKSYDAVLKAKASRIAGPLYCYDAGVADWARAQPDKAVLLGRNPVNIEAVISETKFKAHLLEPKAFEARIGPNSIVLDVRDRVQRDNQLFPFREQRVQLEEKDKIDAILEQAKREKKTLLVYDAVGKQVDWFQYYLENKGVSEYYFMKGGAQGYSDAKYGKVTFGTKKEAKVETGKEPKPEAGAAPQQKN
jgi:rhodanese-related sulfurtransferase